MKIRTDYVSNSSSSSFIIKDNCIFDACKLTKKDINDALIALIGKEKLSKNHTENLRLKEKYYTRAEVDDFIIEHPNGISLYDIYDMHDSNDAKLAHKNYDDLLSEWDSTHIHGRNIKEWEAFVEAYSTAGMYPHFDCLDDENFLKHWNGKEYEDVPLFMSEAWKYMRAKLGIKTRKEVLDEEDSSILLHFGDNDVYAIDGFQESGKHEKYASDEEKANAKYESDSYSITRFFEILVMKLIEMGKIDPKDKELLSCWNIPDDHWCKRNDRYKDRKSFLENEDEASVMEIVDELVNNSEYCMHEG